MKIQIIFALAMGIAGCSASDEQQQEQNKQENQPMKAAPTAAASAPIKIAPADWDWSAANDEVSGSSDFASSKALCRQVIHNEPPASDAPDEQAAPSLKGCSSEALYFGIGVPADAVKARQCAFLEIAQKRDDSPFSGRGMLMTIYANGSGATRNLDVAMHLACGIDGAAAESHGRVSHLAALKGRHWSGTDFSFCDDITSGLAGGFCASHEADIAGAERDRRFAVVTRGWSPGEKRAFEAVKKAHAAFADAHSGGEIDLSGTLRGAMAVEAEESLNQELLGMIESLQAGKAPIYSAEQLAAADAALNAGYRAFLASDSVGGDFGGTVTREGVRDAQRAWLAYRDSFIAFAAIKYPKVARTSIAAWLTNNRARMWRQEEG
jgi:uncharacterized protein YecT (DUF1311 family)